MKLLLGGLLMALMLISELMGLVALARYTASTEARPSAQGSFTIVATQGNGDYQRVEWDGSSCGVWEVKREGEPRVKSSGSEGGIIGEVGDCRGVHIRPHVATTRQPGVGPAHPG